MRKEIFLMMRKPRSERQNKKKIHRRKGRRRRTVTSLKIEAQNKRNIRRYSKKYLRLRNRIFLRDHYKCQCPLCEKPSGVRCNIHHIKKFSTNVKLRQNKFNLITICRQCSLKHIDRREEKWEDRLKIIARRNELEYRKNKLTKQQILEKLKEQQQLPEDFEAYQYKTEDEIVKIKREEYWLTKYYRQIKFRTENKNSNSYHNYGGRGIKMCEEWKNSYDAFVKYINETLGERPDGASIDRIDNDKGYEPGNIRWATAEVQGQNRRTTILNEESVAVILILYYKYKFKISEILDRMNLPSRAAVSGVINCRSWLNICSQYKSIITNEKALKALE